MNTHSGKFWMETNKRHTILFWCVLVRRGWRGWRGGRGRWGRGQERGQGSGGGIFKEPSRMITKLLLARFTFWRKKMVTDGPTDGRMDQRTKQPTDGWTNHHVEMCGRHFYWNGRNWINVNTGRKEDLLILGIVWINATLGHFQKNCEYDFLFWSFLGL